jgi:predicted NAD/FAD-binding protein
VSATRGTAGGVQITTAAGTEHFDEVVFACHPNQTLELLRDASVREREILGAIRYQPNRAILHTDPALLPKRRRAWAAWNYFSRGGTAEPAVSVSYLLNRLQPLPCQSPVMVTLNPLQEPDRRHVLAEFDYEHPVFDRGAVAAQRQLHEIQGQNRAWFAGAWTGYGFHEDGLRSGLDVARELKARAPIQALAA